VTYVYPSENYLKTADFCQLAGMGGKRELVVLLLTGRIIVAFIIYKGKM
jgi:hypothetical protein